MAILNEPYDLTPQQIDQFRADGFIKLKNVFNQDTLGEYGDEITRLTLELNPNKDKPLEVIDGSKTTDVFTLKSIYDGGFLAFMYEGKECRISVSWIHEMMKDYLLAIEKKRKYWHVVDVVNPNEGGK